MRFIIVGKEIEHKYLVKDDSYRPLASSKRKIAQGYLSVNPEAVVRVRIIDAKGFLTVKSKNHGATRNEWEYEIPLSDAEQMMALCQNVIIKMRHIVPFAGFIWEVDEFGGNLQGLTIAEIELPNEDTTYELPPFAGKNVTGDPRYYNSNLSKNDIH